MVVGGLTMTEDGGADHILLRAIEWSEDVKCMGRCMIWVSKKNDHQIREMNNRDGSMEAISRDESEVSQVVGS